ncbi:MAG: 3-keto-disaccharide hydrolase [Gemmataceae bacterium]
MFIKSFLLLAVIMALPWLAYADEAKTPTQMIRPFDQKNLNGFSTWLKKTKGADPQNVFTLKDGVLRCGDEDMGYLSTKDSYKDYHLKIEYRWGRKNPNDKNVRNSGVLLHGTGPDGSQNGVWKTSIECQLAQGCEGDLILIKGKKVDGESYPGSISSNTVVGEDGKTRWQADGKKTIYSGKQFWWSKHQAFFKELIDTRGTNDVASPLGEWTKVECVCKGAKITIKINGVTVNECFDANPAAGQILLQSEGHEVFFRNMEICPLK